MRATELFGAMQMPGSLEGHVAASHLNGVVHAGVVTAGGHRFFIGYADFYPAEPPIMERLDSASSVDLEKRLEDLIRDQYTLEKHAEKCRERIRIWVAGCSLANKDFINSIRFYGKWFQRNVLPKLPEDDLATCGIDPGDSTHGLLHLMRTYLDSPERLSKSAQKVAKDFISHWTLHRSDQLYPVKLHMACRNRLDGSIAQESSKAETRESMIEVVVDWMNKLTGVSYGAGNIWRRQWISALHSYRAIVLGICVFVCFLLSHEGLVPLRKSFVRLVDKVW